MTMPDIGSPLLQSPDNPNRIEDGRFVVLASVSVREAKALLCEWHGGAEYSDDEVVMWRHVHMREDLETAAMWGITVAEVLDRRREAERARDRDGRRWGRA